MSLNVEISHKAGVSVVHLRGQLTLGHAAFELREAFTAEIQKGFKNLVVWLDGLTIIDSTGVAVLISAFVTASKAGGDLVIASPSEAVRRVFLITKLFTAIGIFDTVDEAIGYFEPGTSPETPAGGATPSPEKC